MAKREDAKRFVLQHLKELLDEEISEAGTRLAKAEIAEGMGLFEAAQTLKEVALDEAKHATLIAALLKEKQLTDTRAALEGAIEADSGAAERERDFVKAAREAGMKEAVKLFQQLSKDETAHVTKLRKALENLHS